MFAVEEPTVLGSAENQSVSRGDICCSYLGKHQNLCLGWGGKSRLLHSYIIVHSIGLREDNF